MMDLLNYLNVMAGADINFIVPLQVYPFDVMVSYDQTDKQLRKSLKKYKIHNNAFKPVFNTQETDVAMFCINNYNQSIIRIKKCEDKYTLISYLNHELLHAVTVILDRMGFKLEILVSDEAYAYLMGYLSKEIYSKLKL